MVDELREAYRLISLWDYEVISHLSLCTIMRCNKIKRRSIQKIIFVRQVSGQKRGDGGELGAATD